MRKLSLLFASLCIAFAAVANNGYEVVIDLTKVVDDRVQVWVNTPPVSEKTIDFHLPKIIPGTYMVSDYGRYATDFKAYDKKGRELEVTKTNENTWTISKANKLARVSYWVDDTYDGEFEGPNIYPMGGTNIEDGKSFVINGPGWIGYLNDMEEFQYDVKFIRDESMYASTGLIPISYDQPVSSLDLEIEADNSKRVDHFQTTSYHYIQDSPIMYNEPDTSIIMVGNTEVLVSSYSPNKVVESKFLADQMREILNAQKDFLGGTLPVDKYAFLFYFETFDKLNPVQGALEHSYSSYYYLPEVPQENLAGFVQDIAAHEFFHIVTPLTIHSEEIQYFNYDEPVMSKHLWLYEGVTEYHAHLVQVRRGLIDENAFLARMKQKIESSTGFYNDTLAFTDLSANVITQHNQQYGNVYQKGALIGMCLDIYLRDLSDGEYGLKDLVAELSDKYGKDKPFKDDELFDVMAELSYPEVKEFMQTYVAGTSQLPYEETFSKVGATYGVKEIEIFQWGIQWQYDSDSSYAKVSNADNLTAFGEDIGFQVGDLVAEINGTSMKGDGIQSISGIVAKLKADMKSGDDFTAKVYREDEDGNLQIVDLDAKVQGTTQEQLTIEWKADATDREVMLRKAWLNLD